MYGIRSGGRWLRFSLSFPRGTVKNIFGFSSRWSRLFVSHRRETKKKRLENNVVFLRINFLMVVLWGILLASLGSAQPAPQPALSVNNGLTHYSTVSTGEGLTLEECYRLALKRSETVAIQKEIINEAEGRFLQALSGALPKASYEIEETRQDGSGTSNFTLKRIPQRRFTVSNSPFYSVRKL